MWLDTGQIQTGKKMLESYMSAYPDTSQEQAESRKVKTRFYFKGNLRKNGKKA